MTSEYRKLTRKKRTLAGSTQLWLGSDHVLMVRSTRFIEEYRRFRLVDIQAVVAGEDSPRLMLQIALIILAVLCFLGLAGSTIMFGRIFFAMLGMLLLGVAAYDVVRGQRCKCRLLTEVSSESLDPVTRVRDYQQLLRILAPAVAAVQGTLTEEDHRAISERPLAAANFIREDEFRPTGSRYLQHALYVILLVNAVACAAGYLGKHEEALSLAISILMSEIFLAILLLWKQRQFGVTGPLKILAAAVVVLAVLDTISAIGQGGYLVYLAAENGRQNLKPPVFWDIPWIMLLGKISITWRIIAGLTGLAALWIGREAAPSPSLPAD